MLTNYYLPGEREKTNAQQTKQTKYDTSSTHLHANREKHWASVFLPELSQVLADKCEVQKFSGVLWLSRFSSTEQHIPITAFLSSLLHCSIIQPQLILLSLLCLCRCAFFFLKQTTYLHKKPCFSG